MRKTYNKPKLWYEDFRLSQSIASGCEGIALATEGSCAVHWEVTEGVELIVFTEAIQGCEYTTPNPDDLVCYHAPSDGMNVYSS